MKPEMKRQRVEVACDKCRLLKAKCDGRKPVCTRCEGYSFRCSWSTRRRQSQTLQPTRNVRQEQDAEDNSPSSEYLANLTSYNKVVQSYEALIQEIRANLDSNHQAVLDLNLSTIRRQMPADDVNPDESPNPSTRGNSEPENLRLESPSYVGKVNEIHFIRTARRCMQGFEMTENEDSGGHIYAPAGLLENLAVLDHPLSLPSREEANNFMDIYLSTIHIAYPFLCKTKLLEKFENLWSRDPSEPESQSWLALFNFIFAIGAYYNSFPHGGEIGSGRHFRYFEQGLYFSRGLGATCSLTNVWALLVQCFFLLAVCHTNRCWNTLGFAIRMGQSIGLHVESPNSWSSKEPWMMDRKHHRRTWYSMYVLDRLLALQLGRPMAINEDDFQVELPSLQDQSPFIIKPGEPVAVGKPPPPPLMEYFLAVVRFSQVVGLVIRELYRPTQVDLLPDQAIRSASLLDQQLSEWKTNLPRHLRFDLGHTLEGSVFFKRQRNMLAVKFHHLRALIFRPFLCSPLLQMNNKPFMDLIIQGKDQISHAEWTCISEARQTARLLHNVMDERSLVHDFPWWQMISCLICASSILFVAERFHRDGELLQGETSSQSLREDAETCLKVFEALSVNSGAAKKAAEMLGQLSGLQMSTKGVSDGHDLSTMWPASSHSTLGRQYATDIAVPETTSTFPQGDPFADMLSCEWPSEISNSMEWSIRFLGYPDPHRSHDPEIDPPAHFNDDRT